MFLASALLVVCVAYAIAAVVGEIALDSQSERALDPGVRAGFGLVLALVFFSGMWFVMPAPQVLALGAILLVLYGIARRARRKAAPSLAVRAVAHSKALGVVVACTAVFFAPLLASRHLGPFTEGGGDVSIYADTAKYLYDRDLTEYGFAAKGPASYWGNLKDAAGVDMHDRHAAIDPALLNPPAAEYAPYRIMLARVMSPFFYAPWAMFSFLAGDTNYPVFYGLLALMYGLLLRSIWSFFRPYGPRVALGASALAACSHGLAAVFYNVYAAQSFSLAISALVLAALPVVRPLSAAGLRIYAVALVYTLGCYTHYLAVVGPMVAAGLLLRRAPAPPEPPMSWGARAIAAIPLAFLALSMGMLAVGSKESFTLMLNLVNGTFARDNNTYMGDAARLFSLRWNDFALGVLSQQHFQPYMAEFPVVMNVAAAAAVAGGAALLVGLAAVARTLRAVGVRAYRNEAVVYAAALFVCLANLAVTGSSLYTQAKGAQNILVYVYAALMLPLAIAVRARDQAALGRRWVKVLAALLAAFASLMLVLRVEQAVRLGYGKDRSGVTEPSYFSEARRILAADEHAFVLMEPRNSADLYTTIQPFFGARMVPVRHLSLQTIEYPVKPASEPTRITRTVMLSDLIAPEDVPHLWFLRARCDAGPGWLSPLASYEWTAQPLAALREPTVILAANDYEADFGKRPLGGGAGDGVYSFVRFGSAMLYVPPGFSGTVVTRMEPREPAAHGTMAGEVAGLVASGTIAPGSTLHDDGTRFALTLEVAADSKPRLLTIARYGGEYWLNVALDGLRRAGRD
ncbi:MAG: hypothetical protein ACXWG1_13120 [Usitatibacter sp.]